jgi:hypothetical protein
MNMKFKILFLVFVVLSQTATAQNINWTEVAPGVWKGIVGKPETYDLLKASGAVPNKSPCQNDQG